MCISSSLLKDDKMCLCVNQNCCDLCWNVSWCFVGVKILDIKEQFEVKGKFFL